MKQKLQTFGRFLSAMVMPNIAAFIAWGLITALFIPDGWMPNETLNQIVGPMQRFLLPTLIAFSGGKMIADVRGGVVGAIAAIGVMAGTEQPMFIGAMIAGPLGGWCIKKVDELLDGHIPNGFEMLVTNFSAGILGAILAIVGCLGIEPVCAAITAALASGVNWLVQHGMLWLTSILVEPAKVLFLNNAINHGIFTPLGMDQVAEAGKSIFFLIESNPGPGLGLLAAYWLAGKGNAKDSAPGAMIIEFFGGIHEIYFPYVLMNPITLIGLIAGGSVGVIINSLLGGGLVSAASPGSIIAILGMCAPGTHLAVILSVIGAAATTCVINTVLLKAFGKEGDMEKAKNDVSSSKAASKGNAPVPAPAASAAAASVKPSFTIAFACDAGMGSSAMGAASLSKKLKNAGMDVNVPHYAINDLPAVDYVVTHESLVDRAKSKVPNATIFPITSFIGGSEYDQIVEKLAAANNSSSSVSSNGSNTNEARSLKKKVNLIYFACDAGMGSSAMGAAALGKKLKSAGSSIEVRHSAINDLPKDTAVIVTHVSLAPRAKDHCPNAEIFPITNFMGGPEYDRIVEDVTAA